MRRSTPASSGGWRTIRGRLRSLHGREQQRAISDLKFLFRTSRGPLADRLGRVGAAPPGARDPTTGRAVLDLIATAEGDDAARIAARWWAAQPEGFSVLRDRSTGCVA
jgi:hypothetical protein